MWQKMLYKTDKRCQLSVCAFVIYICVSCVYMLAPQGDVPILSEFHMSPCRPKTKDAATVEYWLNVDKLLQQPCRNKFIFKIQIGQQAFKIIEKLSQLFWNWWTQIEKCLCSMRKMLEIKESKNWKNDILHLLFANEKKCSNYYLTTKIEL